MSARTPPHTPRSDAWDREGTPASARSDREEEVLQLRARVIELEAEAASSRARIEAQRATLDMLQTTLLMQADGVGDGDGRPGRTWDAWDTGEGWDAEQASAAPLTIAAGAGDVEAVRLLLRAGAAVRAHGDAALLLACRRGHACVVPDLLDAGADLHVDLDSPLLWACIRRDAELAGLLVRRGANPHALRGHIMRLAAASGDHALLAALVQGGSCAPPHPPATAVMRTARER